MQSRSDHPAGRTISCQGRHQEATPHRHGGPRAGVTGRRADKVMVGILRLLVRGRPDSVRHRNSPAVTHQHLTEPLTADRQVLPITADTSKGFFGMHTHHITSSAARASRPAEHPQERCHRQLLAARLRHRSGIPQRRPPMPARRGVLPPPVVLVADNRREQPGQPCGAGVVVRQ